MVGILVLALVALQQQFDQGDYQRAMEMLGARPPGAAWSIGQELVARARGGTPDCKPQLVSSFAGTLEITCLTGEKEPYRFSVDLVRHLLLPADARTRELVETVDRRSRAPADAGAPGDGG